MVNGKGLDNSSILSPVNEDGAKSGLTETSAVKSNVEGIVVFSESEYKAENLMGELQNEENPMKEEEEKEDDNDEEYDDDDDDDDDEEEEEEENEEVEEEEEEEVVLVGGRGVNGEEEKHKRVKIEENSKENGRNLGKRSTSEKVAQGGSETMVGGDAKEEKQKDDIAEANLKEKDRNSRKRSTLEKVAQGGFETMAAKGEEVGGGNEEEKKQKAEASSKKRGRKSGKTSRWEKAAQQGSGIMISKGEDKPESSGKKKRAKRAASMGMIFMCSSKTKEECYQYKVLGLPANKRDVVEKIYTGMRLFLFDFDLRLMYGIYKAAGPGGFNIKPKAFKSQFPSQVRFTVLDDCLPLAEEEFSKVIKENYYTRNKFDCQLTSEQVKKLCELFVAASKGCKSNKFARSRRVETRKHIDEDRIRRQGADKKRRSALGRERHYDEHRVMYEREVFASPVAPLSRVPPISQPAVTPYAYERTLEMDAYRREPPILELHHAYRREPILEHHNAYRREPILELRDAYRREPIADDRGAYRREPVLEHRDAYRRYPLLEHHGLRHLDENASRDLYISYREPPPYRDPIYSAGLPQEHFPPAGLPHEYRRVGLSSEYRSSGPPPEYHGTEFQY